MAPFVRGEQDQLWQHESGRSSPGEILAALSAFNAEGRPVWKPMHMQPIYRMSPFVTKDGNGRGNSNAYIAGEGIDKKTFNKWWSILCIGKICDQKWRACSWCCMG